jgi:hypothetical protein
VEAAGSSETLIDSTILAQQTVVYTLALGACGLVYVYTEVLISPYHDQEGNG